MGQRCITPGSRQEYTVSSRMAGLLLNVAMYESSYSDLPVTTLFSIFWKQMGHPWLPAMLDLNQTLLAQDNHRHLMQGQLTAFIGLMFGNKICRQI